MARLDKPESMAPGLLVAMPQLRDPNFDRSVVLLSDHDDEGAMGLVVNRRLPVTVADVLLGLNLTWRGPADEPAWGGGPVQPQSGWLLFEPEGSRVPEDCREVMPGVFMSASIDALRELARRPPKRFRLVLGYSGWGGGQLENEVIEGAWLLAPPESRLIFDVPAEQSWAQVFADMGLDPFHIVPGHGVQ